MLLDAVCNGNELFIIFSVALFNKKLFVISDLSVYSTDVYLFHCVVCSFRMHQATPHIKRAVLPCISYYMCSKS